MKRTGIFYGSSTGQTRDVAFKIADKLGIGPADIHDVASSSPSDVGQYDNLILGSSTWGSGDLEDDWYDFLDGLQGMALRGKRAALFGCGDTTMADTFCDAVGTLYDRILPTGVTIVGTGFPTEGLVFAASRGVRDGKALGLLLDNVNHEILTNQRIAKWTAELAKELE